MVSARGAIAAFLGLSEGDPFFKLIRVHYLESEPLSVVESYLPAILQSAIDQFPPPPPPPIAVCTTSCGMTST